MNKKKKIFLVWLCFVVAWNYSLPGAAPIYDVLVAVALSFFVQGLESYV